MGRSFNGSSNVITIGTGFHVPTTFSVACWINYTSGGAGAAAMIGSTAGGGLEFRLTSNAAATSTMDLLAENVANIATSTGSVKAAEWTSVGASYDGTNWKFYIGGTLDSSGTNAHGITGGLNYLIGENGASGSEWFAGAIADLAVWNTILSGPNFASLATGVRPGIISPGNLIGWWELGGYASPEPDLSGNGNTGALTGTTQVFVPPLFRVSA